jgi:hypothetical protein
MSFAMSVANTWAAVLSLTFPRLIAFLGPETTFKLYAFLNVVAFGLIYLFVPETRLKSLQELDDVFSIRTKNFVQFYVLEYPLWLVKSHILRQRGLHLETMHSGVEYTPLMENER